MPCPAHIPALLQRGADDDLAFSGPGRPDLTYGELRRQVERTVAGLNQRGIGRGDRVAIVLPNGPEMASAFVSVAAGATTAPLNPAYTESEFAFYLQDLGAKALILAEGANSPARAAAAGLGVRVLEAHILPDLPAGSFDFAGEPGKDTVERPDPAEPDDVALVLHTSGTTSRPKIVPLLQRNICVAARNIRNSLRLGPRDRCLNVMPLFHVHGLLACVLSTLSAGASLYCPPGFNALKFFRWLDECDPTWYSAVPTMHQAILARANRNREAVRRPKLRFIRSSSAPLPVRVAHELEATFGVPVVEAYAMTEAAHQITCNPLPPAPRKVGTVGVAAGPEVSVVDEDGNHLDPGRTGEIVIRGPTVTPGYEHRPAANEAAFTNGWFRTGDQGLRDEEGYVTITGRLKEVINRGGEKISPREVDEVLMDHPEVRQAVTFAVPHDQLGEEVGAAVVLRKGGASPGGRGDAAVVREGEGALLRGGKSRAPAATDPAMAWEPAVIVTEIRNFAATRLAPFKVPRRVWVLDEIPRGPTGKVPRLTMAERLGLGRSKGRRSQAGTRSAAVRTLPK